jgi:putative tricarboxylic transport membrane protein
MSRRLHIVTAFIFILLGAAYLKGSLELPRGTAAQPSPGYYPFALGIGVLALGAIFLIDLIRGLKVDEMEPFPKGKDLQRIATLALMLVFFAVTLRYAGYLLCSVVFLVVALWVLGLQSKMKIILISLCTALVSYYVFVYILDVSLPRGWVSF